MRLTLHQAHRLARISYGPRALAFGYVYLALLALLSERGGGVSVLLFGILQFLVYPHLAYLHARIAADSKRAELNNLLADSFMLGAWAAQMHFALWPSCGLLFAICLNNAGNGGVGRLVRGMLLFAAAAVAWGAVLGFPFEPNTGPLVSGLSLGGIIAYASWIGVILHEQNRRLLNTRNALRSSEEQFRFIAENAGDLVAVLDAKGRLRYASASHLQYFEPDSFAPGRDWLDLVHPDAREQARQFLGALAFSGSSERIHLRMRARASPLVECQGNPVRDEKSNLQMTVLVSRDITARVLADIDRQLTEQK